jgi:hypothetical protein
MARKAPTVGASAKPVTPLNEDAVGIATMRREPATA